MSFEKMVSRMSGHNVVGGVKVKLGNEEEERNNMTIALRNYH